MIFHLNKSNLYDYLAFQKGDKYEEWVNNTNYDKDFLAKSMDNK
jgi:hypothetical protein